MTGNGQISWAISEQQDIAVPCAGDDQPISSTVWQEEKGNECQAAAMLELWYAGMLEETERWIVEKMVGWSAEETERWNAGKTGNESESKRKHLVSLTGRGEKKTGIQGMKNWKIFSRDQVTCCAM